MIIIEELINASRKVISAAIETHDEKTIKKIASDRAELHTDYLDVNADVFLDKEPVYLTWLVKTVQTEVDAPCAIDSPSPEAIEAALKIHKGVAMVNSISLEKERYDNLLPIIAGTDLKIVALCMSDDGMPETVDDRLKVADKLIKAHLEARILLNSSCSSPRVNIS